MKHAQDESACMYDHCYHETNTKQTIGESMGVL